MEDLDATTIESLRAQLLSERSVSKAARQRVDELDKRVVQLEEQLRVVTIRRKKAENAMAEVLVSLEKNGFSYFSEAVHSSSDVNGINPESKICNNSGREFSTSPSGRLLQKSCKCCLSYNGKTRSDRGRRRRTSSTSTVWSTPKGFAKSICHIEQRENRAKFVEAVPNAGFYDDGKEESMEIAVQEQAQLIGQHEAEENAQKEWEEKFRERTICSLDSCESGNLSHVIEKRHEIKAVTMHSADKITSHDLGVKPSSFLATADIETECLQPQQCSGTVSSESSSVEFPGFAISDQGSIEANANWKQQQDDLVDKSQHPPSHALPGNQSAQNSPSHAHGNLLKGESAGSKKKLQVKVLSEKANGLDSVLDALQSAKLSLTHKLGRFPLSREDQHSGEVPELEPPGRNGMDVSDRPHGVALDLQLGAAQSQASILGSRLRFSSTMSHPDMGVDVSAGHQLGASPWTEPRPRFSTLGQNLDLHLDAGRVSPGLGQYSHTPYAGMMLRMPSDSKISRSLPSNDMKMRSYSFYDDHSRSMMHR